MKGRGSGTGQNWRSQDGVFWEAWGDGGGGAGQQNWGVIVVITAGRPEGPSRRVHNGNRGPLAMGYASDSLTERQDCIVICKVDT